MITIRKVDCPTNRYNKVCPYSMDPEFIVIHNTANNACAANEISYMHRRNDSVSFHFAVDDKEAVQGIDLNRNSWHAGDGRYGNGNRKGISIEICYSLDGGERFRQAQENAAELTAYLLNKYGWDISKVKKHQDFNGKYCPHRTLEEYGWDFFLDLVKKKLEGYKPRTENNKNKENKVKQWQLAAIKDGYKFPKYGADGEWGTECESVAKKAVCKYNGVIYRNKNLTKIIQKAVGVKVDGLFGKNTRNAVINYQKGKGLVADGIVGINTWKFILGIK